MAVTVSLGASLEWNVANGLALLNAEGFLAEDEGTEKKSCLLKNEAFFASRGGASHSGSSCADIGV